MIFKLNKIKGHIGLLGFIAFILFSVFSLTQVSPTVGATSAANFNAGNIISDTVFTDTTSMSVTDIQNFLNSKVSSCDTQGTLNYTFSGVTKTGAQWAQYWYGPSSSNPNPAWASPPFTCLKDYTENGLSTAQIIYNAAQQYQINPQVLIVTLQKEQGLVADTWPTGNEYQAATGYGCPDSTPGVCSSAYYGLTNQINHTGQMFRAIMNSSPTWYSPYTLGNNTILYNPATSCGSSVVNITTRATSALYDYTPYQPNAAALAAGYGNGDSCSAYGNRNFYLYFTDWFGSTQQAMPGCDIQATNTNCVWQLTGPNNSQFYTTDISERNSLVSSGAYSYNGIAFYTRGSNVPNSVPVYRLLDQTTGQHFWSTTQSYTDDTNATVEGVAWYSDPAGSSSGSPVYQLTNTNDEVLTTDATRATQLVAGGYTQTGVIFNSPSSLVEVPIPNLGSSSIYRLYNPNNGQHFWTASDYERDGLISAGYQFEGIAWATGSNTSVYRLYNPNSGQHFWTASVAERNNIVSAGYIYEGVAWSEQASGTPIYRLYNPNNGQHFWTASVAERNNIVSAGYIYEGVAWTM